LVLLLAFYAMWPSGLAAGEEPGEPICDLGERADREDFADEAEDAEDDQADGEGP